MSHADVVAKLREQLKNIPRQEGQTVVVVIDALVSNPGVLLPWEEMTKVCKEEGVYSLIDAAHAIGQVDIDLSVSQPDFFVSVGYACIVPWSKAYHSGATSRTVTSGYMRNEEPR